MRSKMCENIPQDIEHSLENVTHQREKVSDTNYNYVEVKSIPIVYLKKSLMKYLASGSI